MWVRVDDGIATHPKILKAGIIALGIQIRALCYASRNRTDGFITQEAVPLLLTGLESIGLLSGIAGMDATEFDWSAHMVDQGLWEAVESGYLIHDYLEWNLSKKQITQWRKKQSDGGRKGMKHRYSLKKSDVSQVISGDISTPVTPTSTSTDTLKTLHSSLKREKILKKREEISIPENWAPNESHRKLASARGLEWNIEAAHFKGKAQEKQWLTKDWDLKFKNWLLQEIKFRTARQQR